MSIQAARRIPQGREIAISCTAYLLLLVWTLLTVPDFSEARYVHFQRFTERQRAIESRLQFSCSCPRCRRGRSADKVLQQIQDQQQALDDWITGHSDISSASPDDALRLIRWYNQEGLEVFLDVPYGYTALTYNAVGKAYEAQRYARSAVDARLANGIKGGPDLTEWQQLARYPKRHWSWRIRA